MVRLLVRRASTLIALIGLPAAAGAQSAASKLSPELRPFLDAGAVARARAIGRLDAPGSALVTPGASRLVLTRPLGALEPSVDVFVSLTERNRRIVEQAGGEVSVEAGSLMGARVPVSALATLAGDQRVRYVRAAHRMKMKNDLAMVEARVAGLRTLTNGTFTGATGAGAIVGIFDTGIDFTHADFKNADGSSRILYLWDQTVTGTAPGTIGGQSFTRGNECTNAQLTAGTCSERDIDGHGTHVAGTAAGNGRATATQQYAGAAPNADIIAVKGGDGSFSSLNVIEGVEYIFKRAGALGRPAVVNLSLGGQYGSHDGTDAEEVALDSLQGPGRVVVIAAGNEGGNPTAIAGATAPRLFHAMRTLNAGDTAQFRITVPVYTPFSGAGNDEFVVDMWYDGRDSIQLSFARPNGTVVTAPTHGFSGVDNVQGAVVIDNASNGLSPQNGDNEAIIDVFDNLATQTPASGDYVVTVKMLKRGGTGRFDAWEFFETDNFYPGTSPPIAVTSGGDNGFVVGSPGNSARAVTVAAYTTRTSWTSISGSFQYNTRETIGDLTTFSSGGPTRPIRGSSPRLKPEISAPGKGLFSAYSSTTTPAAQQALISPDGKHVLESGTSMATPVTTGSIALLLAKNPTLAPEDVKAILTNSARSDGFTARGFAGPFNGSTSGRPNTSWGYGKLDAAAALAATPAFDPPPVGDQPVVALTAPAVDTETILRNAQFTALRLRLRSLTTDVTADSLRFRLSGTNVSGVAGFNLYYDADSNGVVGPNDAVIAANLSRRADGTVLAVPNPNGLLPANTTRWWMLVGNGSNTAAFGQTLQVSLDSADVFFHRNGSAPRPRLDVARVTGPLLRIGGVVELAATQQVPTTGASLAIGQTLALQITVSASTLEGGVLDSLRITAASGRPAGQFIDSLTVATTGSSPATRVTVANPFATSSSVVVRGLGIQVPAGGTVTLNVTVHVTDRLQQGETLALNADAFFGTGALSTRVASATIGTRTGALAAANILQAGEALLLSENPVRDGAVIFSYATTPRSIAVYSFSGRKVREFTNLPANSITWNVRAESSALPNGMYVVAADVGGKLVRQRLMILSPSAR